MTSTHDNMPGWSLRPWLAERYLVHPAVMHDPLKIAAGVAVSG